MRDVARNPRQAGGDCRACGNPGALVLRPFEKVRTQTRREEPVRADGSQCEPCCLSAISTLPFNEAAQSFRLGFGVWNLKLNFP